MPRNSVRCHWINLRRQADSSEDRHVTSVTAPGWEPAEPDALVLHKATSTAAASSVQDVNTITLDTAGWRRVLTSIARLCVTIPLCAFASVQTPPDTQPSSIVLPACPELKQGKRKKESLFSRHIRCLFKPTFSLDDGHAQPHISCSKPRPCAPKSLANPTGVRPASLSTMLDSLEGRAPAPRRLCLLPCLRLCY